MESPDTTRPYMPGYGIAGAAQGGGLLPWSWAAQRLSSAQNYWVSSVWPDGRPHLTPVWGMWDGTVLWFTCSVGSRKARNLRAEPRCCVSTEGAMDPVVIEGSARFHADEATIHRVLGLMNDKYHTDIEPSFLDPVRNATIGVRPEKVIGMRHDDFTGSPTRWVFPRQPG